MHREVFFLGYHLHWSFVELMEMAADDRRRYVQLLIEQIDQENSRMEGANGRA